MSVDENLAVFLQVRAGDGFAPGSVIIERSGPQHDVLAVERPVALADRHLRSPRVEPHGREAVRLWIEAGDSRAAGLRAVSIEESEIRLQKLAVLHHELFTRTLGHPGLAFSRVERVDDAPVARKLRQQFLAGAGSALRLVLIVVLLGHRRSGGQEYCNKGYRYRSHGAVSYTQDCDGRNLLVQVDYRRSFTEMLNRIGTYVVHLTILQARWYIPFRGKRCG